MKDSMHLHTMKIELKIATLADIGTNKVYACKTIWTIDW